MIANGEATINTNVNRQTIIVTSSILEVPPVQWFVFAANTERDAEPPDFDEPEPAYFPSADVEHGVPLWLVNRQ